MKRTIKLACILLSIMLLVLSVAGCGSSSPSEESSIRITTSSQAINAVKNYKGLFTLKERIGGALGFKSFYDPEYGTSSATQNSDGSWDVTIKGSMLGYVDDYRDDLESFKFEVSATVSESGNVTVSVRKAY